MSDLVVVENLELVPFFTKGDQVKSILERLTEEANSYVAGDLSVKKNRDAVKAMVTKFTKSKTYLEGKGKELAAEYKAIPKAIPKAIDANRKLVKDTITDLQEVVRKPLTDWENEQQAIADKLAAEEAAALLSKQKEVDHEMALLLDDKFNQEAKAELNRIEQERIAYEAELKNRAAAEAKQLAESQAAAKQAEIEEQKQQAIRDQQRAILEKEQAEQREKQLKIDAENAEKQRVIDAENAEKEKVIQAERAESRRLADIETAKQQQIAQQQAEEARLAAEQKARNDDREHRRVANNMIIQSFGKCGIGEDEAKRAIEMMLKLQVPYVAITY